MTDALIQNINPFTAYAAEIQEITKRKENKLREQVIATFSTPHGLQLLDTLEEMYIYKSVCPAGAPKGYGYMREGQNSLILKFRSIIQAAQQG